MHSQTGVVMFDHAFPKAWTAKQTEGVGGFLLSCLQISLSVNDKLSGKVILQQPRKDPLAIESPFSRGVTKQLDSDSFAKTPTSAFDPLAEHLSEDTNPLSLRVGKGGTMTGTTRRHNHTRSGLNDLLKKGDTTSPTNMPDEKRLTYIIFGKTVKDCCVTCIFVDGDDQWSTKAQEFADNINIRFEELYESTILGELKDDFDTLKREEVMDPILLEKVKNTFLGFQGDMEKIKTRVLTGDQAILSPKRTHVAQVFDE
jgi:hypothetical protein